jgi:predicted nucleic acid-binding Zn ribbon protein
MPLYVYRCPSGHKREVFRRAKHRADRVQCLECNCDMRLTITNTGLSRSRKTEGKP